MPRVRPLYWIKRYGCFLLLAAGIYIIMNLPPSTDDRADSQHIKKDGSNYRHARFKVLEDWAANLTGISTAESIGKTNSENESNWDNFMELQNEDSHWKSESIDEVLPDKYVTLTGTPRKNKGFLTIGIPTIRRPQGAEVKYLADTLKMLIENISVEDMQRVVLLLFLADVNRDYTNKLQRIFKVIFAPFLKSGFLLIMQVDSKAYPKLQSLKQNYGDQEKRVTWRAKQVIDFAYMFYFAKNLSEYYLQLEDDVISTSNFVNSIEDYINQQGKHWVVLNFSALGFIGKLFRSRDLKQLAMFLKLFYQEMPVDWLYPAFAKLLAQDKIPLRKPALFQHMGKVSSLALAEKQQMKLLKDPSFQKRFETSQLIAGNPDNPEAYIFTSLEQYESHDKSQAYTLDKNKFFWGKEPHFNDTFTIVFTKPHRLKGIQVITGDPEKGHDFLRFADVFVGTATPGETTRENSICDDHYLKVGSLFGGSLVYKTLENTLKTPIDCVRILVTQAQEEWVIINIISIWTIK